MREALKNRERFIFLDGGLGTMLQAAGLAAGKRPESVILERPEILVGIHAAYLAAGSDIICTNTFGANEKKLAGSGYTVEAVVEGAIRCAKEARVRAARSDALVALDVGPLGELLEPVGTLSFEEAYELFAQVVRAGARAGADLVMIETMADLYEAKAAVLAAVEQSHLPVFASMTFEQGGRSFTGTPVEAMAATLEGLGVTALGINCSLGPERLMPIAQRLCAATRLPVYLKPNAGLPDPSTGVFDVGPEEFCRQMQPCLENGISMLGGCCGTTPETIARLKKSFGEKRPAALPHTPVSRVCSATRVAEIDRVRPVGERINPTGKKRLQEALRNRDMGYIQSQAVAQRQDGAAILDVNVGAPGVNEVELLPLAVKAVQAVSDLPLQLDSANPAALEAALRVVNGKPLVNSTTGEAEKLEAILPLCKRYGAAVIGLTLDEAGIPEAAEARLAIARRILEAALEAGIPREDVYIDCLVLTASAVPGAALKTLDALRLVKRELGLKTLLGVSNISFGLPARALVNQAFLTMALEAGLDLPILNPAAEGMMGAIAAHHLLMGRDEGAEEFVEKYGGQAAAPATAGASTNLSLGEAIERGLKKEAAARMDERLAAGEDGMALIQAELMPALDRVGAGYEKGNLFLPQLLGAAGAAQAAFDRLRSAMGQGAGGPPVVVATVQGDVHDIGKNIAKVLLENYGFSVTDLGRDVSPERVVEAARASGAKLVGLSALMTTTLPAMERTVALLRASGLDCKVLVAGAVLTRGYAEAIGADYYAPDAKATVDAAREVYGKTP